MLAKQERPALLENIIDLQVSIQINAANGMSVLMAIKN
jgi:hypothetical protein